MELLPNLGRAIIALEKLRDYALNMEHPEGRHKAAAFKELLGIEARHADVFAELIKSTLASSPAQFSETDEYGGRWTTYHHIVGLNARSVVVTVGWLLKKGEGEPPRLISCYIETKEQEKLKRLLGLT